MSEGKEKGDAKIGDERDGREIDGVTKGLIGTQHRPERIRSTGEQTKE